MSTPSFPQGQQPSTEQHAPTPTDVQAIATAQAESVDPSKQTALEARLAALEAGYQEALKRNVAISREQMEMQANVFIEALEKRGAFAPPEPPEPETPAQDSTETPEAQPPAAAVVPPPEKKTLAQRFLGE